MSVGSDCSPRDADTAGHGRRDRTLGFLRRACGLILFAVVTAALIKDWHDLRIALSRLSPAEIALAEALVLAGLFLSALTWRRSARELGSDVEVATASKIYLLGQLGKYLPGSVWALAAQTELGNQAGIPRSRGLATSVVAIAVNVVTALAIGLAFLPALGHGGALRIAGPITLLIVCALTLSPPVLSRIIDFGLRLIRRPGLERDVTWGGITAASVWSVASWLAYGMSVWLLAVGTGAPAGQSFLLCVAGVPLAMTVGFLAFVTPSGIGVREAVLVAALAPVFERPEALAVALVARFLFTAGDLVGAASVLPVRVRSAEAVR